MISVTKNQSSLRTVYGKCVHAKQHRWHASNGSNGAHFGYVRHLFPTHTDRHAMIAEHEKWKAKKYNQVDLVWEQLVSLVHWHTLTKTVRPRLVHIH